MLARTIGKLAYSALLTVIGSSCGPRTSARTTDSRPPLLFDDTSEGALLDEQLWLRGPVESGDHVFSQLISVRLSDGARRIHFDRGVVDFVAGPDGLWVLHSPSNGVGVLSHWSHGDFRDLWRFPIAGDPPMGVSQNELGLIVVSTRTVRLLAAGTRAWKTLPLRAELTTHVNGIVAVPTAGGSLYVGFDHGEFGGGLKRIDLTTGAVTTTSADRDQVTGAIADPRNPACVLVSVGLEHMSLSHGRILRVCGDRASTVFEKRIKDGEPAIRMTDAFYGIASANDRKFWAVTKRAIYRFDGEQPEEFPLPQLEPVGAIPLTRKIAGVIVFATGRSRLFPIRGFTPRLIPLGT